MPRLDVRLDGDGAFADIPADKRIDTLEPVRVAALAGGMESGKPSVAIGLFLPHGQGAIVGQTSLALFLTAADALRSRHGDPRPDSLENWIERTAPVAFRPACGSWHVHKNSDDDEGDPVQLVTCGDRSPTWRAAMLLAYFRTGGQ